MPSMKKKLFLMLSLTVFPGYMMHGMEKNYCLRAPQPSADNTLRYGECPINKDRVSATLYQEVIKHFPIFCVDIILINPITCEYLTILRKDKPAKGAFYPVGGRLLKGETYFDAAMRICSQEVHITAMPLKILGTFNHIYPDSAWNCPSQTPDVLIVAICTNNESISLDRHHDTYKWRSLYEPHGTEFTEIGRRKTLKYLVKHNIINT
jgi:hypothetical protein